MIRNLFSRIILNPRIRIFMPLGWTLWRGRSSSLVLYYSPLVLESLPIRARATLGYFEKKGSSKNVR